VSEAWALLLEYNRRCAPPWREYELEHKLRDAFRNAQPDYKSNLRVTFKSSQPKPHIDPTTAVENWLKRKGVELKSDYEGDLWEASPVRPDDDWTRDGITLLENLYAPGEAVNFVVQYQIDSRGKAIPGDSGETVERNALIDRWRGGMPHSEAGGWFRMNPLDGQGIGDANVTAFRFALLECDAVPIALQLPLLAKLPLPIAAILSSGGKSLHAWVRVEAASLAEYTTTVRRMLDLLTKFGIDGKNKNPSRLSRLPGVVRTIGAAGDGRQRLLFLNPNATQKPIL
jgi:hypothetical protein